MPCTTILVGKNASYDGSTLMARNEDAGAGTFDPKKYIVVEPHEQPKVYKAVLVDLTIPLPENPMRYTAMPNAIDKEGFWGEAGINEANVAMSETETITSNSRVLGADPLVPNGISEEDMLMITLPYIHSAREGVLRMGSLLEEYGTYEMNGMGFQDQDEIWWLETIGGHHWIAKRVPDDAYAVIPNQLGIDYFDFVDAFGEKRNHMCSDDMLDFIKDNFLGLSLDGVAVEKDRKFNVRAAFGSHSDSDHVYNSPRTWFIERHLNPKTYKWEGESADYTPASDDLPWCLVPERKITIEDMKYLLSSYYQGTEYNPYDKRASEATRGRFRPIGINRNNFVKITQLRTYVDKEIMGVEWIAVGPNAFNTMVPFYANVHRTPEYLANATALPTTENIYWATRIIAALADANYSQCIAFISRYELKLMAKGHELIAEYDKKYKESGDLQILLECNDRMAEVLKEETYKLLDDVLYASSMQMTNAFSMNDY